MDRGGELSERSYVISTQETSSEVYDRFKPLLVDNDDFFAITLVVGLERNHRLAAQPPLVKAYPSAFRQNKVGICGALAALGVWRKLARLEKSRRNQYHSSIAKGAAVKWGPLAKSLTPKVVRAAGVEPALLSELDFESSASTNSTTPAAEGPPHATEAKAASSPKR